MAATHPLLMPYTPTDTDPFDATKAAHLLSRTGFGGTQEEIDQVMSLGPQKAADWMLDFPDAPAEEIDAEDTPDLSSIAGIPSSFHQIQLQQANKTPEEKKALQQALSMANREAVTAIQTWWLNRMAHGDYPLHEKLTFLWHGHFTSSAKDERAAMLLWRQNELLRRNAAGNFETFVRQVSRDPAMIDYLNNNENKKQHPNENYARELMELFTLGIGNYTEDDIKQSARAFTGWSHDGENYVFQEKQHDDGIKKFFGHSGNFNGDDIITLILQKPVCTKYIAGKVFKWFGYDNQDDSLAEALGQELRASKLELRPLLRTILTSRAFYGPLAVGTQIKGPVQLVMGTIRMLELKVPSMQAMNGLLNQMGQVPLMPPNVKGWPGGQMWINTSTLFIRYNTCVMLTGGDIPALNKITRKGQTGKPIPPGRVEVGTFNPDSQGTPEQLVDEWVARLIQRPISDDKKKILLDAVSSRPQATETQRRLVQLIVSMPDYQLC
jgi:hypothetical protein